MKRWVWRNGSTREQYKIGSTPVRLDLKSIELDRSHPSKSICFHSRDSSSFKTSDACSFLSLVPTHDFHHVSHRLPHAVHSHPSPSTILHPAIHPELADQRHTRTVPSSIYQSLAPSASSSRKALPGRRQCAQEVWADDQDPASPREHCRRGCDPYYLWSRQWNVKEVGRALKH